ncbi:MAG TPA: hypothetical protein VFD00_08745 [Thermoclostridium sp.]|nr:hypothetical protein [Thermoclostridium sp.]
MDAHIYKNKIAKNSNIKVKKLNITLLINKVISIVKTKIEKMNVNEIHPPENPTADYQMGWRKDS